MKTQHDLSFSCAKLDLQALYRTARIAYWKCLYELREKSEAELRRWDDKSQIDSGPSSVYLSAIAGVALELELAGATYSALKAALTRDIQIVNHNPEKSEVKP